jgi:hypothetical protein
MKNILLLLLIGSCSFFQPKSELSENSQEVSGWIYNPYDVCSEESELCATGEAKTYAQADAQARNNLASIFEVKVKSEFNAHTSSSQTFPWSGAVKQEVQQSLQESVDQVLETVQIKRHVKHNKLSYALGSIDKRKASELIKGRISKLDDELNTLWAKRSRTNLRKIVRLYLERDKLNERYSIVAGTPIPAQMTYKDIIAWRESRPKTENLTLKVGQAPDWMTEKLKELLTEAGFRIVNGDSTKAISLNVDSIKEFLNVDGFEKYTFTMNMMSFQNSEKNKVISASETVTGRSQADALLKVKSYFTDYMEQHLSDLHLD